MCSKSGYLHLIVPKSRFKLLSGAEVLTTYEFNTKTAKHLFCAVCGIKAFYVPRSHPEGYSVNARCLDDGTVEQMTVIPSDGKNWEKTHVRGVAAMNQSFRVSPRSRRIGVIALALIVVAYLVGITYWRFPELGLGKQLVVMTGLWGVGVLALVLLVRAWRFR